MEPAESLSGFSRFLMPTVQYSEVVTASLPCSFSVCLAECRILSFSCTSKQEFESIQASIFKEDQDFAQHRRGDTTVPVPKYNLRQLPLALSSLLVWIAICFLSSSIPLICKKQSTGLPYLVTDCDLSDDFCSHLARAT